MTACPTEKGDGGINVSVDVSGLLSDQSFCMTWALYQAQGDGWDLIDARLDPICASGGDDFLSDFATCYDGLRFLVRYDLTFYGPDGQELGTAEATSGGGPDDVCQKNTDTDSWALVQFNNEGNAGGVNPGVEIDQVCSNDKIECENGELVSALWLQPDDCEEGTPDSFCALAFGEGLTTVRTGVTLDGLTRYIFSTAGPEYFWSAFYLAFDPGLEPGVLHLYNSPWVLGHVSADGYGYGRFEFDGVLGSFRFDNPDGSISVGFVYHFDGVVFIVYDHTGGCDTELSLDAQVQIIPTPECVNLAVDSLGVIETGGSTFSLVFDCEGDLIEIPCDANGLNGGICEPALCEDK
jgi:hypothetical protein